MKKKILKKNLLAARLNNIRKFIQKNIYTQTLLLLLLLYKYILLLLPPIFEENFGTNFGGKKKPRQR